MRYLLDTNACIRYINGRAPNLRVVFHSKAYSDIVVSSITKAEMYFGSQKSQTPERSQAKQEEFFQNIDSLPFDDDAAEEYQGNRIKIVSRRSPSKSVKL
ncbi:MAG: type II toxin-antitoxin system VapC family toxin [Chloroflexota bacterium]|nr:type II toxin-antitoxin system VapC family toxin [Chloroflexota bacterium]